MFCYSPTNTKNGASKNPTKCITNLSLSTKACGSYVVTLLNGHVSLSGVWQGFVVQYGSSLQKKHVSTMSPRGDWTLV